MTVKEFIALLQQYPDNFHVVLSSDEEGNEFSAFESIATANFDEFQGSGEENAVILYPSHRRID